MAINLSKGQTIDLRKDEFDLSKVTIGLGWDMKKKKSSGFLGGLLGGKEEDYDLDAVAFLLDSNEKVANLGTTQTLANGQKIGFVGSDIIFFNNLRHPSGQIWLTGDNRTGAGDGDDEQVIVNLNQLDQSYQKIIFLVTIYQGRQRGQHFGQLENAFMRAVDAKGKEMARYTLSGEPGFDNKASMVFGEVYRRNDGWKFRALGNAEDSDSFVEILKRYVY